MQILLLTKEVIYMMKIIYEVAKKNDVVFLILNTVLWAVLGISVWAIISMFTIKEVIWCLVFMGYAGFFIGFLGGFIYLANNSLNYKKHSFDESKERL